MKKMKNHIQLIGRLGARPEVKVFDNGNKVARFNIAVSDTYTNRAGDKVTDVQWYPVVAWNSLAGVVERQLAKGIQVAVDGRLVRRTYVDREGAKRVSTEIVASELLITRQLAA